MKIEIKLETGRAVFIHCADSVDDWAFIKNVVDQLLKLNPDEEVPVPGPARKLRGPYKKHVEKKKHDDQPFKKINKNIIEFIRSNCLTKDNDMLVASLKDRFGINTTVHTIKWWMTKNGISRRRMQKEADDKGVKFANEKDLKPLPPEDNY